MDTVGLAAVITAVSGLLLGLLAAIGAGIRYVVKMILDAYKQQVEATEKAKNSEIESLWQRIKRHMEEILYLRKENEDIRAENAELRAENADLRRALNGGRS